MLERSSASWVGNGAPSLTTSEIKWHSETRLLKHRGSARTIKSAQCGKAVRLTSGRGRLEYQSRRCGHGQALAEGGPIAVTFEPLAQMPPILGLLRNWDMRRFSVFALGWELKGDRSNRTSHRGPPSIAHFAEVDEALGDDIQPPYQISSIEMLYLLGSVPTTLAALCWCVTTTFVLDR